jgi:hypothetical protein
MHTRTHAHTTRQTIDKLVTAFGYPPELYDFTFDWLYMMRGLIIDKVCLWGGTVQRLTVLHVPLLMCLRLAAPMHRPVPMLRPATVTWVTLPPPYRSKATWSRWTDTNTSRLRASSTNKWLQPWSQCCLLSPALPSLHTRLRLD